MTTENLIEDVEFLLDAGTAPCEVARRLGYDRPESLVRHLDRAGRHDLAGALRLTERAIA